MTKQQKTLMESEAFVRNVSAKLSGKVDEKQVKKAAKKVAKAVAVKEAA